MLTTMALYRSSWHNGTGAHERVECGACATATQAAVRCNATGSESYRREPAERGECLECSERRALDVAADRRVDA